jgi:hypothetical protein
VTVKLAVPAASSTVTSPMARVGVASSSVIVAVPVALALDVVPDVREAVNAKVSSGSSSVSPTIGARTSTLVAPAAIVAEVAAFHVAPPSVETSSAAA